MTGVLEDAEKAALDALLPLVKLDDGALHQTDSLPPMVYQSPLHLDYVCARLAETRKPAELASGDKFERMRVVDRVTILRLMPIDRIKRCRGIPVDGGASMWTIKHHDPLERLAGSFTAWARTGDEWRIGGQFHKLLVQAVGRTSSMHWTRGYNSKSLLGRFYPAPKTQHELDAVVEALRETLRVYGFRLEVSDSPLGACGKRTK